MLTRSVYNYIIALLYNTDVINRIDDALLKGKTIPIIHFPEIYHIVFLIRVLFYELLSEDKKRKIRPMNRRINGMNSGIKIADVNG